MIMGKTPGKSVPAASQTDGLVDPGWYRDLVESAPDAVVLIDSEGHIVLVNAQTERLFGWPRAELIGKPVEILVPERYRKHHAVHRDAYFGEPKVREMGAGIELWGLRKDNTEFPLEISLSPLRTERGNYATASIRDISDRKKAQQQFRALLETAPDAMVIIDQHGTIQLVNAQTEQLFGYRREALIGKKVEILVPERLRERHVGHRSGYFNAPKVRGMGAGLELAGRRKDGSEFPIEISLSPLETEGGTWATAAVRDISDRKREQDAASRLAAIVESSNDAILGKDLDGVITSWNKAAEKLYGYSAPEAIGQNVHMLLPADRASEQDEILARIRRGEQIQHFETVRLAKDGRHIDVSLTISPIHTAGGRLVGASTIGRDISEQKKAEQRFRALLETAPDAMVIIDSRGCIKLVNAQAEHIFGYHRDEMIGQTMEILVPERMRGRHTGHRTGYFASPKPRPMGAGLELWGRRRDGSEFPIEISLSPMQTDEGIWVTAAVRDITDRKAVEEKLARYAENLKQSNQELEQFAYVASHDLQAPLRNVVSFTQLLLQEFPDRFEGKAHEYMHFVVESGKQMQALIKDLLAFSRVGRQDAKLMPTNCEDVLRQVESQMAAIVRERGVRLTHDPLPAVMGAPHEINQLLQNLIGNAIKFQPGENPRVHVSAKRDSNYWEFSVRDWGIGIKPEYQNKIFQIFQRLHTPAEYDGTGIGLALCQKIVTRHGGRIWVESKPGEGSTFYFTLMPA
jgi:PAS domain S-box-containing protein